MTTSYPTTITDNTGRTWFWSEYWGGYRAADMMTHGYDTIRSVSRPPILHLNLGDKD